MSTILSQLKPLKIGDLTAKLPIIQGGMGVGISLSSLAGAVAGAGGIGIISTAQIGFREPDFAEHPQEANLRAIGSELQKASWALISWWQRKTMRSTLKRRSRRALT